MSSLSGQYLSIFIDSTTPKEGVLTSDQLAIDSDINVVLNPTCGKRGPHPTKHLRTWRRAGVVTQRPRIYLWVAPCQPLLPSHELHANPIIVHDQISGLVTPNCVGFNFLHILSHHANISGVIAPFVAEAIELKTVVEPRQRNDVFL